MAKPTIPQRKITANPSRLVDCPPSSERTRLRAPHQIESSETDMKMTHANQFQPAYEIDADEALSLPAFQAVPAPTEAWNDVLQAWRQTDAARKAYGVDVADPAWDAAQARRQAEERQLKQLTDAIPHYTTVRAYETADGEFVHMTTSRDSDVHVALKMAWDGDGDAFTLCCRELVSAIGRRFAAEQEIREQFEFCTDLPYDPAIDAEMRRLEQIDHEAWEALTRFPAATLGELVAKTEFLRSLDCEIDHNELLADLTRIWNGGQSLSGNGARDWQDAMAAFQVAKEASDNDTGSEDADRLCGAMVDAADYLRDVPAPDICAVEWKVAYLQELASMIILEPTAFDCVLSDIRRLSMRSSIASRQESAIALLSQKYHLLFDALTAHPFDNTTRSDPQFHAIDADHTIKNSELEQVYEELQETPARSGRDVALKLEAAIRHYDGASILEEDVRSIAADARVLG